MSIIRVKPSEISNGIEAAQLHLGTGFVVNGNGSLGLAPTSLQITTGLGFTPVGPSDNLDATLLVGLVPDASISGTFLTASSSLASNKLTGALPAISGAALTGINVTQITNGASRSGVNNFNDAQNFSKSSNTDLILLDVKNLGTTSAATGVGMTFSLENTAGSSFTSGGIFVTKSGAWTSTGTSSGKMSFRVSSAGGNALERATLDAAGLFTATTLSGALNASNLTGTLPAIGGANLTGLTSAQVSEVTNLYYTAARFDSAFGAKTADNLTEGGTNLYYTSARVDARIAAQRGTASGLAPLDSGARVPRANQASGTCYNDVNNAFSTVQGINTGAGAIGLVWFQTSGAGYLRWKDTQLGGNFTPTTEVEIDAGTGGYLHSITMVNDGSGNDAAYSINAVKYGGTAIVNRKILSLQNNGVEKAFVDATGGITAALFTGPAGGLTGIPSANLTGALPALDGSALTNLPAGAPAMNTLTSDGMTVMGGF